MATFNIRLATLIGLCFMPFACALECFSCYETYRQPSWSNKCDRDNIIKETCNPIYDRCLTSKTTSAGQGSSSEVFELRTCTSKLRCGQDVRLSNCEIYNKSGTLTSCWYECCQDDLCNNVNITVVVKDTASGLAARFGAILLALFLSMFAE